MRRSGAFFLIVIVTFFSLWLTITSLPASAAAALTQSSACPGTLASQFAIGVQGTISGTNATPNRVHDNPSTSATQINVLQPGQVFTVIDGPQCADGYIWWKIQADHGVSGWVAEGNATDHFIAPVNSAANTVATCPGAPLSRLKVGARGDVRPAAPGNVPNSARVREQPTTTARLVVNLKEAVPFTIIDGPQCGENFVWWKIKSDDGFTGWIAEGDATKFYVRPLGLEAVETPVMLSTGVPGGIAPSPIAAATTLPIATPRSVTAQPPMPVFTLAPPQIRVTPIPGVPLTPTPFFGLPSDVLSVAFSPDGRYVLSGHSDGTLRLWLADTGIELRVWYTKTGITAAQFSPDGTSIYATNASGVTRFTIATAQTVTFSIPNEFIHDSALSVDGTLLMSGTDSGVAHIWNTQTRQEVHTLVGHYQPIWGVAISPNGRQAITASADHTAVLWSLDTGKELRRFNLHTNGVNAADFSPDGTQALTASVDGSVRLWDVVTGQPVAGMSVIQTNTVMRVARYSHDGKRILTGNTNHVAQLWDVATGTQLVQFSGHDDYVDAVAFSPDDRLILTGSPDKTMRLWDVTTGTEIRRFPARPN